MTIKNGVMTTISITALIVYTIINRKKKLGPCSQELEEILNNGCKHNV